MTTLKARIEEILDDHVRAIVTEGKGEPLVRRGIRGISTDTLLRVFREAMENCIGEDENELIQPTGWIGETVDNMLANAHRRRDRNKLRSQQRQTAKEICK